MWDSNPQPNRHRIICYQLHQCHTWMEGFEPSLSELTARRSNQVKLHPQRPRRESNP